MSGRSFRTHRRHSLLGERLHLILGDRLGIGLGKVLPDEIRDFVLGQLAVFIGVRRGEERIEMRSGPTLRYPRPTLPAAAPVPTKAVTSTSVMTSVSRKSTPAAMTAMSKAVMSGESVASATVTGEGAVPEAVMSTSRETVA
jgi:hypothetical protein